MAICVNKWDLNPAIAQRIENQGVAWGAMILPCVPYDAAITEAQRKGVAVVEYGDTPAAQAIRQGWAVLCQKMS